MATRWSEDDYRQYQARAVQLPLGRKVPGLEKAKRLNFSPFESSEAEMLTRWTTGYYLGRGEHRVWVDGEGLLAYPELEWFHHVPNGGWRSPKVANALKRQGVKSGPWDYFWDLPRGGYHTARLEMKRRVGGALSPEQKRWGEWYRANGHFTIVALGWEDARDRLIGYWSLVET